VIGGLYTAGLYNRLMDDTQTFALEQPFQLPAGGRKLLSVLVDQGSGHYNVLRRGWDLIEFPQFSPPRFRLVRGGVVSEPLHIVYAADFARPTAEDTDLTTLGIPDTLQDHLPMGVAAFLLQGKEIPRVQIEEIKRAIAAQSGVAVGATLNVSRALQAGFDRQVAAERRRMFELDPEGFEFVAR